MKSSKMKTVLFVHTSSDVGGGSYCLLNLIKHIDRYNFTPMALLCTDGPLVKELKALGVQVYLLNSFYCIPYNRSILQLGTFYTYVQILLSFSSFKKKLIEINPEIVYLNSTLLYPYLWIIKKLKKKAIIHIREHWPLNEHKVQLLVLQKIISKNSDKIIAINKYCKKMVESQNNSPSIIYDWIDFSERDRRFDMNTIFGEDVSSKKIFLFTGGAQKIKGAYEVVHIFNSLSDNDYRLLILGIEPDSLNMPSDNSYYEKIREIILKDPRITCLPAIYQIKDIIEKSYCMLSFFTIPHANLALAECIILGTPVIAAITDEALEYSENGELAFLYELGNTSAFKKCIEDFGKRRDCLMQLLKSDSHKVTNMFDKDKNIELFRNVLSIFR